MWDDATGVGALVGGRFKLERRLGSGGMGTVWRARDVRSGQPVAVKLLHAKLREASSSRIRMEREAASLMVLDHPRIARAIAFNLDESKPFIAMELVPGDSLRAVLRRRSEAGNHYAAAQAREIFIQLCEAVDHAHQRGVIHRDLKPENIMLDQSEDAPSVKVLDFGLAKLLVDEDEENATTQGRALGSNLYRSPEQWKGAELDPRTDLFSLGAVLFELLTLARAFAVDEHGKALPLHLPVRMIEGNMPTQLLRRVIEGARPLPSALRPELSGWDEIVTRLLQPDPRARFDSVDQLLESVRGLATKLESPASGETPRNRRLVATVAGLTVVAGGLFLGLKTIFDPTGTATSDRPPKLGVIVATSSPTTVVTGSTAAGDLARHGEARSPASTKLRPSRRSSERRPESRRKAARSSLVSLLARARTDPSQLPALEDAMRRAAEELEDPERAARVKRYAREALISGDLRGFEQALRELEAAR